jgi:iron complex outermembrane recepter protein
MSEENMQYSKRKTLNVAILAALSGFTATSFAQTQPAQSQQVEKIEITGSNIKRIQTESATPITVISREQIQRSGATSLNEVLQQVSVSGLGNFSETNTNLSSGGGSAAISLRGLGASYTLTLIDGRRVAPSGFGGATGVATFTDLNSIPLSAIDRIEVLRGSASAIYGADAVGGVINLILRRDFKGGEATASYGTTERSDGQELRGNVAYGYGDMARDRFNVLATFDYYKRERIASVDRPYGASADGTLLNADLGVDTRSLTGSPGTFRTGTVSSTGAFTANSPWRAMPNCPAVDKLPATPAATVDQYCLFNFLSFWDLAPPAERVGGVVKGEIQITPAMRAFARLVANKNETSFRVAPTPLPDGVITATAPGNTLGQTYQYKYRITAGGPRQNDQKIDFYSLVGGLEGQLGTYDWKMGLSTSETKNRNDGSGYVNTLKVAAASAAGIFKPYEFASNPALEKAAAEAIAASYTRIGKAKSSGIDATVSGELFALPGGPLSFAAGLEFRSESISDRCITPECYSGPGGTSVITGANSTAAGGKRTINAQYVEFRAPAFKGLDITVAARRDGYSGESDADAAGVIRTGKYDKVTPQVSVEFRPMSTLLLRGVVGEGFKAPTLFEAYQATSESFNSGTAWRDQRRFPVTNAREDSGAVQIRNFRGGTPSLLPEESKNASVGIVFEPIKDLTFTLDHYVIDLENTIGLPSVSRLLAREAAAGGSPLVIRKPASTTDIQRGIPGAIDYLLLSYANLGQSRVQGTDLDIEYKWRSSDFGRFGARTVMTYFHTYKQTPEPGVDLTEFLGSYEVPRFRAGVTMSWERGPWEAVWGWRYTGKHAQELQNTEEDKVAPEQYHDVAVTYSGFKDWKFRGGVRNVFDKQPSFANGDSQNYSYIFGDPRGRSFWLAATYKF